MVIFPYYIAKFIISGWDINIDEPGLKSVAIATLTSESIIFLTGANLF
jgi:hypothetical protein